MSIAPIDRRVAVHINAETVVQPLSLLRDNPYVVLLGEPGIGKSTALQHEATAEGGEVLTCREVMNGSSLAGSGTAYLDALDEFRSGTDGKDKLLQLANAISESGIQRWRLTCRAEDWRAAADLRGMRRAANNEPVVIADLLPLNDYEARAVLNALNEPNPRHFLDEAHSRGAGAFLLSPLSLRLLHSVVRSNETWPTSRYDLFEKAISALAHEHDPERATDPRPSPVAIVEAASIMCFYSLVSGARSLWRSNSIPQNGANNEYVSIHSLDLNPQLSTSALDTPLFRGEGHAFEPIHKTVSEFLAAQYLAKTVVGNASSPAFPLRRATALITGKDHKAPSELRGLYAWFAAHLQKRGDPTGAHRLIENDAATVLAYGDASAFDTAGRKTILYNLDSEDPFFLASQNEATVLGSLAGDDLAEDFIEILDAEVRSHLQVTVLQALADGPPVAGVQTKLHEIVLESNRQLWMRERAAQVLINSAGDRLAVGRKLLDELCETPVNSDQIALRADILAELPSDASTAQEIRQLLSDFDALPVPSDDNEIDKTGSLISLAISLRSTPHSDLFDAPVIKDRSGEHQMKSEVRSFIYQMLAATIEANQDVGSEKLWMWINNARKNVWDMLDSNVLDAVQMWIDRDTSRRELDLFVTIFDHSSPDEGPWVASSHYMSTVRRSPSESITEGLIELAGSQGKVKKRRRLLKAAAYAARSESLWSAWRDKIVSILEKEGRFAGFIKSLLADPNKKWNEREARRKAKEDKKTEIAKRENIAALTPKIETIKNGGSGEFGVLAWAANHYRNARISEKQDPLAAVIKFTNEEIAAAITEGFIQYCINSDIELTAVDLGKAEAKNQGFHLEYVVGAGLHQALSHGREKELAGCDPIIAIVGLRQSYYSGKNGPSIASWAVHQLGQYAEQGSAEVLRYWNGALDAGAEDLDAIHHLTNSSELKLVSKCLRDLLTVRPQLPQRALHQSLAASARFLAFDELSEMVTSAVERSDLTKDQREIWNFVALALMPIDFTERLSRQDQEAALLAPSGDVVKAFGEICPQPEMLDRLRISVLGTVHAAQEDDWHNTGSPSGIVWAAIQRLGASKHPQAGNTLKSLATEIDQSWQQQLAHAAAEHARQLRDDLYVPPSMVDLKEALAGGPPASPADLIAVVLEEIERYRQTLRSGSETPWKRYWNTDQDGAAISPQIENEDRDRLLELFRIRFERYGIAAVLPEAQRGGSTRVDMLMLSHAGSNVPIEAKRHYNKDLWTAPGDQLAGYASDVGAFGFGVYLVFWFGIETGEMRVPTRDDGVDPPNNADELKEMLVMDLSLELKDKIAVIVLDVSRPVSMIDGLERKAARRNKRSQKQNH